MKELFREIATHPAAILLGLLLAFAAYLDRPVVKRGEKVGRITTDAAPPESAIDDIDCGNHGTEIQRITDDDGGQDTLKKPQADMQRLEHEVQKK